MLVGKLGFGYQQLYIDGFQVHYRHGQLDPHIKPRVLFEVRAL